MDRDDEIRIGISACLLGQPVRYNGGHKLDVFIKNTLGNFVSFIPVCPEVEIGLGVPRETVRLVRPARDAAKKKVHLRMIEHSSGRDHTTTMISFAQRRCKALQDQALCGFIVKKDSPSCGMQGVRVFPSSEAGSPRRNGRGLFTQVLMDTFPNLPVEEEGRLNDPRLRENFVVRIFAFRRLRSLFAGRWTPGDLVRFHATEKMLLLAHDRPGYQRLGRLVASAGKQPRAVLPRAVLRRSVLQDRYTSEFLKALSHCTTRSKNTNVLQHMCGHFKKVLPDAQRAKLAGVVDSYRRGLVPLSAPLTLVRQHVVRQNLPYLAQQTYLHPHPPGLLL